MTFDINTIRGDFPALSKWTYLDNSFVGLMPRQVHEGYQKWADEWYELRLEPGETMLGKWMRRSRKVRQMIAQLVKVRSEEIAFTTCTGSGLNIVINGLDWKKGDNVVFPEWEHNAVDTYTTRKFGVEPRVWHQKDGAFHISDLEKLIDDNTRLVQISEVSYVNGHRLDLSKVAEEAHEHGADVLVDATQAVGAIKVDYHRDKVDYVSVAPYKYLMGPAGLAFLYVAEEKLDGLSPDRVGWKNQIWSGDNAEDIKPSSTASKFEYGTINFQGVYALEKSLEYLNSVNMNTIEKRVMELSSYMYNRLNEAGKELFTPKGTKSPIISFMQDDAVNVARGLMEKMIKVTGRKAHGDHIRASVHFYNTRNDVDRLMEEIS